MKWKLERGAPRFILSLLALCLVVILGLAELTRTAHQTLSTRKGLNWYCSLLNAAAPLPSRL